MRFTLSSSALSNRLSTLAKVINSKNSLAILDCFLFEVADNKLTITASDSENVMRTTIQLEQSDGQGNFAVTNRTILDAVKELPEQPLTIDVDLEALTIKVIYQNGLYNFTAQNANEYPRPQSMPEGANTIVIDANVLSANINRSFFATGQDELRPVMNGLYFDLSPEALSIVASDGHKLVRNKVFSIRSEQPAAFILPKKPANLLRSVLQRDGGEVTIRFDERNAEISFSESVLSCRLIEGRYPNYNSVIPQDNPNEIYIDRKSLIGALRRVLPFASESSQLIRLVVEPTKLTLSSEDIDFATSAKEEISCSYNGTPMSMGFKGSSLTETLNNLDCEEVIIQLADPSRAGVIVPVEQPDGEDILMLIMPMLLND